MIPSLPLRLRDDGMVLHMGGEITHRPVRPLSGGRGLSVSRGGGRGLGVTSGGTSNGSRAGGRGGRGAAGGRLTTF